MVSLVEQLRKLFFPQEMCFKTFLCENNLFHKRNLLIPEGADMYNLICYSLKFHLISLKLFILK